tara:strand:+ start:295 stop:771 length:477 start_codon:yes stop_codon:yes gene_type:complete
MTKATFGAGCFWSVEAVFRELPGVIDVAVGYSGGHRDNPTYQEVCTGVTGHAEVVQIEYDESKLSYEALLDVFWDCHDPTQLHRQGVNLGNQYRTVIFTHDEVQTMAAMTSKKMAQDSGQHSGDIVTEISPAKTFWRAEEYHQQHLAKMRGAVAHVLH